ncbi:MAG: alpha/beta hydrolase [Pseudomonadota bacterium]
MQIFASRRSHNIAPRNATKPPELKIKRRGAGVPIVFVPGFLETSHIWEGLIHRTDPFLPDTIDLALPGHPPWLPAKDDHLTDDWIDDVAESLAAIAPSGIRIVGHSTGGLVALELARLHPSLVRDVLLVGALHSGDIGGHKTLAHEAAENPWIGAILISATLQVWLSSETLFQVGLNSAMAAPVEPNDLPKDMRDIMRAACPRTLRDLLRWMSQRNASALSELNVPVSSIIGTKDIVIAPEHQIAALDLIDNTNATLLPTGHLPFFERPDLFDPVFGAWLANEPSAAHVHKQLP